MKIEIYTIPLKEGFEKNSECPFCAMKQALEVKNTEYFLSPAYMEEEIRDETNRYGFCNPHLEKLAASRNVLGVSLMMQSLLMTRRQALNETLSSVAREKKAAKQEALWKAFDEPKNTCAICRRIDATMERYTEAFFFLWKKEKEFRETVFPGKGFCLEHFSGLYQAADRYLSGSAADEFKKLLAEREEAELSRMQEDLDWFIKKFDYRFANEPWKNAKDALPRALLKLNGIYPSE